MMARYNNLLVLLVATLRAAGCATTEQVQPFSGSGRVWPEPPELARIEYVSEFSAPGDLGIKASFWNRMLGVAVGANSEGMTRPMAVAASKGGEVLYVADPGNQCVHRFDLARGRYDCLVQEKKIPLPF